MPYLAPKLPLYPRSDHPGGIGMIETYDVLVQQNLKNLVLTNPGERVMNIGFGVGIKTFLFQPNNSLTYDRIASRITAQVNKYMPFLEIIEITFNNRLDEQQRLEVDGNYVDLNIKYFIKPLSKQGLLSITDRLILTDTEE